MFSLSRIIGTVPIGALQPTEIQIVGAFACPGGTGGVPVELRVTAPPGGPMTTYTATTSTGAVGMPPVESVIFLVPSWEAALCGTKIAFEVRGNCSGQWTAWQSFSDEISCPDCPRISLQTAYGACSGTPLRQTVTITATVMLPPGTMSTFTWDFGDGSSAPGGTLTNSTGSWNTPLTLTTTHDFDAGGGPYVVCLKPRPTTECPKVCVPVRPDCNTPCCDEVTIAIDTQPLPCAPVGGGSVSVQFSAALLPAGCPGGPFEWKVTNLSTGVVLQPFTLGGPTFSYLFPVAATYKVNGRVQQATTCDDPVLTDSVTFTIDRCTPCSVVVSGPKLTPCTDGPPTPLQTYTATTTPAFAGPYTWEVRNTAAPATAPPLPPTPVTGGTTFSFAFPGPGTYKVTLSLQTKGCANPTAADSLIVTVPPCTVPTPTPTPTTPTPTTPTQTTPTQTTPTQTPTQTTPTQTTTSTPVSFGCGISLAFALLLLGMASVGLALSGCMGPAGVALLAPSLALAVSGLFVLVLWIALCRDCPVIRFLQRFFGAMALLLLVLTAIFALVGLVGCSSGAAAVATLFGVMVGALTLGANLLRCP